MLKFSPVVSMPPSPEPWLGFTSETTFVTLASSGSVTLGRAPCRGDSRDISPTLGGETLTITSSIAIMKPPKCAQSSESSQVKQQGRFGTNFRIRGLFGQLSALQVQSHLAGADSSTPQCEARAKFADDPPAPAGEQEGGLAGIWLRVLLPALTGASRWVIVLYYVHVRVRPVLF